MMYPARKTKRPNADECEHSWHELCQKDGVPCPGILECRHVTEEEILCVPLKSGMKIVKKQRSYRPL